MNVVNLDELVRILKSSDFKTFAFAPNASNFFYGLAISGDLVTLYCSPDRELGMKSHMNLSKVVSFTDTSDHLIVELDCVRVVFYRTGVGGAHR